MSESVRIVELRAENVKRLRAISVRPDGAMVEITGRNGQGKSSILDAICYALGGKGVQCEKPIRDGESEASVVVDLGDIIVERTWNASGNTYLSVRNHEGAKYGSPQAILDRLTGSLTFDPLAFTRMSAKEQVATLKGVAGLDFSDLDARRAGAYEDRTLANRELKSAEAELATIPLPVDGTPDAEVMITDLMDELRKAQATQAEIDRNKRDLEDVQSALTRYREMAATELGNIRERIESLRLQLSQAAGELESKTDAVNHHVEEQTARIELMRSTSTVHGTIPDIAEITARMQGVEATNQRVRAKLRYAATSKRVETLRAKSAGLTERIEELDQERKTALASAPLPVDGLAFEGETITLDGIPFAQLSSSEQLRVSVSMGISLNPRLKVMMVRDGSLLDSDGRKILAELAASSGYQIWLERATDGEAIGVVIEDGSVVGGGDVGHESTRITTNETEEVRNV